MAIIGCGICLIFFPWAFPCSSQIDIKILWVTCEVRNRFHWCKFVYYNWKWEKEKTKTLLSWFSAGFHEILKFWGRGGSGSVFCAKPPWHLTHQLPHQKCGQRTSSFEISDLWGLTVKAYRNSFSHRSYLLGWRSWGTDEHWRYRKLRPTCGPWLVCLGVSLEEAIMERARKVLIFGHENILPCCGHSCLPLWTLFIL